MQNVDKFIVNVFTLFMQHVWYVLSVP